MKTNKVTHFTTRPPIQIAKSEVDAKTFSVVQ